MGKENGFFTNTSVISPITIYEEWDLELLLGNTIMDNKETTMENTNGKDNNPINGRCLTFTLMGLDNGICNKPILVPINGIMEIFPVSMEATNLGVIAGA